MKKSLTFFGIGVVVISFIGFLLRTIAVPFFQKSSLYLFVFGGLGLLMIIGSFIFGKSKKFFLWFGLGSLASALSIFGLRAIGIDNNLSLFIISLIVGLILLIWGIAKRGN